MTNMNSILSKIKESLSSIPDIQSLKIGLEKGIGAKDCTFIRIIVEDNSANGISEELTFQVVYGFSNKTNLESLYTRFFDLEYKIKDNLVSNQSLGKCLFINSVNDEDNIPNLKVGMSRFKIIGIIAGRYV